MKIFPYLTFGVVTELFQIILNSGREEKTDCTIEFVIKKKTMNGKFFAYPLKVLNSSQM
jgi:hypothetical protein